MSKGGRSFVFYIIMLVVSGILIYGLLEMGDRFEATHASASTGNVQYFLTQGFSIFTHSLKMNIQTPVAMLLLQVISILCVARIFGWLFVKMKQPSVIGEIVAGIVLGPSVLAQVMPDVSAFLFTPESLSNINILSQIGLILFMFAIGMELDISEVRKKLRETIVISHSSMIIPFLFGMAAAYWTYPKYAAHTTPFVSYALFIGIAMSITAFPVLARIIQEKGLTKSHLGTLSLASAANGDVTAWCLLAVVIAIAQSGTFVGALYTVLFAALFLLFMFYILKPFLNIIGNIYHNQEVITKTIVAFMILILIISAYVTEVLGIHALFGSFIAGVIMPANVKFRKIMTEKVEDVSLSLFLPLFFVSTGLKTQIGLISTKEEWLVCGMFILVAVVGKVVGTTFPARITGESWKDSWSMGALMNTRGLMELVVLTIGYEMGIIPPSIFVMLVLMTLATTIMTGPFLNFIDFCFAKKEQPVRPVVHKSGVFRVLLSFGRTGTGKTMLSVAHQVFSKGEKPCELTALHLTVGTEVNPIHTENFEISSFEPILEEADRLQINIHTRYDITNDAGAEIVHIVNNESFDFLMVGAGISMSTLPEDVEATKHKSWFYPGDLVKDKTQVFIEQTHAPVGIFVNRDFDRASQVIVILEKPKDVFLLNYASNLIRSNQASVCLFEVGNEFARNKISDNKVREFLNSHRQATLICLPRLSEKILQQHDFMLISYPTWMDITDSEKEALQSMPSTLIIHKK